MEIVKQLNLIDPNDKTLQPISALNELPPDPSYHDCYRSSG